MMCGCLDVNLYDNRGFEMISHPAKISMNYIIGMEEIKAVRNAN